MARLYAGADRALLVSKKVTKGCLEAAAEAGHGQHLTSFQAMHAAIMQKAESGNRYGLQICEPLRNHYLCLLCRAAHASSMLLHQRWPCTNAADQQHMQLS